MRRDGVSFIYEVIGSGSSASVLLEGFLFENTTASTGPDCGGSACFERDNLATPLLGGTIPTVAPEPETGAMLTLGLVFLVGLRWRRS